ncbi:hypothetical protein SKAU_G00370630 [Synaphobranchus kaupii]|uniref:Uncharacterized protein n=1 Tax=Synaphobranchus kaupii TaxID=118154 RepID=A0A9Q1EG00_SYNKA|nr:hypothetical protein SKAU_G00370630 [Synaphobranchus kaupii]
MQLPPNMADDFNYAKEDLRRSDLPRRARGPEPLPQPLSLQSLHDADVQGCRSRFISRETQSRDEGQDLIKHRVTPGGGLLSLDLSLVGGTIRNQSADPSVPDLRPEANIWALQASVHHSRMNQPSQKQCDKKKKTDGIPNRILKCTEHKLSTQNSIGTLVLSAD